MICLHTTVFYLYISYIERGDPVCGLPSPYISIEKVPNAQDHGNCLYTPFIYIAETQLGILRVYPQESKYLTVTAKTDRRLDILKTQRSWL